MKLTPEYLDNLIKEMVSAKSIRIVEREIPFKQDKEDVTKTLQLPKFAPSDRDWETIRYRPVVLRT